MSRVTVGIVTKDGRLRCARPRVAGGFGDILADVIVIDDTSDLAIDGAVVNPPEPRRAVCA
jgi:hypothetical protein